MRKIIFKYGLISGFIMVALFILSATFVWNKPENYDLGEVFGFASIILCLLAVFFGIQHYRDEHGGGEVNFKTAMNAGIQITFIAAFLMGLYTIVFYEFVDPEFADKYYKYYEEQMRAQGKPTEMVNPFGDLIHSSLFQGFFMFMNVFVIGAVITAISALILRTKQAITA